MCGKLKLAIQRVPYIEREGDSEGDTASQDLNAVRRKLGSTNDHVVPGKMHSSSMMTDLRPGSKSTLIIEIIEAAGLPASLCHYAYCEYFFFGQLEPVLVPEVYSTDTSSHALAETSPRFHHLKVRMEESHYNESPGTPKILHYITNSLLPDDNSK